MSPGPLLFALPFDVLLEPFFGSLPDFPIADGLERRLDHEQDVNVVTEDQAAPGIAAQRLVEREAQAGEEVD